MSPDLSTVPPEVPRDRWGRPLVVPPNGGKPVPYTRCTTFVGSVEDRFALGQWQQRMVAIGLADRKDLLLAVAAHRDNKTKLNELCNEALEAAQGKAGATMGTALHSLTEQVDRGQEPKVPGEFVADIAAYVAATRDLTALSIEQFSVNDRLKVGGTPDRVVRYEGKRYIADLKTGASLDYGYLSIAAQLALYARSVPYDPATGTRLEPHGADAQRGIVIHAPAGSGTCTLHWVDLELGWEVVKVAADVRAKRQHRRNEVLTELHPLPYAPLTLADQIRASSSPDAVRALWRTHAAEWTDELTELAKRHIAALEHPPQLAFERNPA